MQTLGLRRVTGFLKLLEGLICVSSLESFEDHILA